MLCKGGVMRAVALLLAESGEEDAQFTLKAAEDGCSSGGPPPDVLFQTHHQG